MDKQALKYTAAGILAVMLGTLLLYWPGLSGPFILDDWASIDRALRTWIDNPDLTALKSALAHNFSGHLGRAVSVFSFILTGLQYGVDPRGYKFHNLLLHLANGLLLFFLLVRTLPLLQPSLAPRRALLVAGVTCTFWLIHPLLVSTVLYAVQRMAQLAVFFTLLALLCYVALRRCETFNKRFVLLGWILFPCCLLLALLSKETGVLIPLYVLLFEVVVYRTTAQVLREKRHIALWLGIFVLLPLLLGAAGTLLFFDDSANYSNRTFTLGERLLTQLHVVAYYARMILAPRISSMSLFQDDFPLTTSFDALTALLLALLLATLAAIWLLRKRQPVLAFGLGFFIVSHLLESTFIPLELVFEHRNYLAAAGLLLLPVYYLLSPSLPEAQALRWLPAPLLVIVAFMTFGRVKEWSSQDMLINVAIQEHPASVRTRTEYANFLLNAGQTEAGIRQLEKAHELDPADAGPVMHMLYLRCLQGQRDADLLERAVGLLARPASVYVLSAFDALTARQADGRCTAVTLDDTARLLATALAVEGNQQNPVSRGFLLRFRGIHAFLSKNYVDGVVDLRMAHEATGMVSMLQDLFKGQLVFGQLDDAEDTLDLIRELNNQTFFHVEDQLIRELEPELAKERAARTSAPVQ